MRDFVFGLFGRDVGDDEIDVMSLVSSEGLEVFGLNEFSINEHFSKPCFGCRGGDFFVEALTTFDDGGEEFEAFVFFEEFSEMKADGFGSLRDDGFARLGAMLDADLGKKKAKEVVDFGDRADGGFSTTTGDALLDCDGGWESSDEVEVGFFELACKLTSIG